MMSIDFKSNCAESGLNCKQNILLISLPCIDLTLCHVTCSTLVIKQKLPGIYVQPSYKSALSKDTFILKFSFIHNLVKNVAK